MRCIASDGDSSTAVPVLNSMFMAFAPRHDTAMMNIIAAVFRINFIMVCFVVCGAVIYGFPFMSYGFSSIMSYGFPSILQSLIVRLSMSKFIPTFTVGRLQSENLAA